MKSEPDKLGEAQWWEVKTAAFNTKKKGEPDKINVYQGALCKFDLENLEKKAEEWACKESKKRTLPVPPNQFYTKEFFIDRAWGGPDPELAANRMNWVFHDFNEQMPVYEAVKKTNSTMLLVSDTKFLQCGVNKLTNTNCNGVYNGLKPLNEARDKLMQGIRNPTKAEVEKIVYPTLELIDQDAVEDYLEEFERKKSSIVKSENAKDWLLLATEWTVNRTCEATP